MPEATDVISRPDATTGGDPMVERDPVTERMLATAGLGRLVAEAEAVWLSRAASAGSGCAPADVRRPAWRPFEDAFPTFYQFTNRPPR